ncbi:S9 family peptidase [Aliikangiella sp. G2MR2-5]|uniref:S9 family peptidase n=1 Tax=Aliikangiella sp. G2MR2-5 TaxID=2788943 RepID=UPI0018AA0E16|nr:S9 family peptidase [Aliikangiella sp. G2MR2-5]
MNLNRILIVLLFVFTSNLVNAKDSQSLIPVEHFAKHAQYMNIKISPDGKHLAFNYRDGTQVKLAVLNRKSKEITAMFEFGEWKQVLGFHWGNNERVLMEVQKRVGYLDKKGGARHLYAANIDGTHRKQIFTTQRSGYNLASLYEEDPKNVLIIKSHSADYDPVHETSSVKAAKLNIYTGKVRVLSGQPKEDVSNVLLDSNDEMRVAVQYITDKEKFGWGEYKIYIKEPGKDFWKESALSEHTNARLGFRGLSKDGTVAYITSDKESKNKTSELYAYNLISGEKTKVFSSELVDVGGLITSEEESILGFRYSPNYNEVVFLDKEHRESKALAALMKAFPGSDVGFTSYTENGDQAVVSVSSDINPGDFYLFNFKDNALKYLASRSSWIDPKKMAQMLPIEYTARDGVKIQGYLTLPKGQDKNLPLIINPHGGPHGPRDNWGYNPDVQFLANRGYAVLQMNFRGSGGYGRAFEESGYRKWGREMQDDVTDATLWAIETGIANPEKICIYGGSYGGYATLMGVVKEPDLYKCGLGYVGVYDLETMFTAGDIPTRESGVRFLQHVLGEDKDELRANSPARNVEKIKAALFIAHGREDVRVPMEQYDVLIDALDKAKIPYESMVRDEGHGYQKIKNRIDFYVAMEKFFAKHLK